MESEPIRDRASLLTSACPRAWASIAPLSAMGDEPGRAPAAAGTRVGVVRRWDSISPSSAMESELAGWQAPFRKRMAVVRRRGSIPPLSAHGRCAVGCGNGP